MTALVLSLPDHSELGARLANAIGGEHVALDLRRFPDGESYVRVGSAVSGREVVVVAGLDRPDPKVMPLLFALETARELGAHRVGLVAPYLCYMRQDRRFLEGEAVAARLFARVLSRSIDWLVTVDPHLHRIHDLREVYAVPTHVVHAAPAIAAWVKAHIPRPLFVGPDIESEQWVSDVAARAGAPWIGLRKVRHGDTLVEVSVPEVSRWRDHTPVLVDDILSTGRTLLTTIGHLAAAGMPSPTCIAVHGIFADGAYEALLASGATTFTCNSVPHPTNAVDLAPALAAAMVEMGIKP